MKRSFYLFNPGIMERKDNTLKFTPIILNDDQEELKQQPRYIPIEDVAELYAFGSLRANSALYNFLGQKVFQSISSIITRTTQEVLCPEKAFWQERLCSLKHLHTKTKRNDWGWLASSFKGQRGIW